MAKLYLSADLLLLANGRDYIKNGAMIVSDSTIEWVGPKSEVPDVVGLEKKEYPNCTILPGLIDSHVHLSLTGTMDPWHEMTTDSTAIAAIKATNSAMDTLRGGVTLVRDMGSKNGVVIDVAEAIEAGLILGCDIIPTGRCIVMTGGHVYPIGVEVDGEDEARKAARSELKRSAKGLKVVATGGILTPGVLPGSPQLTIKEMLAVTEEAHKAGVLVGAHAHGTKGIKNALHANCDTIEHCSYLDDEAIKLFLKKDSTMVSTLIATKVLIAQKDNPNIPTYVTDKIKSHAEHESDSLRKAISSGIKILAGSDSGTALNPHNQLIKELELLVLHGMTEIDAIKAATLNPAKLFGLDGQIGTLDAKKSADFIVVSGNPLANIGTLTQILAVYKSGRDQLATDNTDNHLALGAN